MSSQILKINLKKYNLSEIALDNLACEFYGKILDAAGEGKSSHIEIEFIDSEIDNGESLAKKFLDILNNTFLAKKA